MLINVALQDGFDGDTVLIRVDGAEAYRGEQVTTRTQISHAADMQLDVPDNPFTLEVDVPTRGVHETFQLDPHAHPNVALSVRNGGLVAAYPERLGFV
jgi:hypothetical protein